eukprot:IDg22371t1
MRKCCRVTREQPYSVALEKERSVCTPIPVRSGAGLAYDCLGIYERSRLSSTRRRKYGREDASSCLVSQERGLFHYLALVCRAYHSARARDGSLACSF